MPPARYRRPLQAAALGLAALLTVFLSGLLSPRPAPRYTVTDLGVLPSYDGSYASAVNSRGEVAVTVSGPGSGRHQACVYRGGRLTSLSTVPGGSDAQGINAAGDVAGVVGLPGARRAFLGRGGGVRVLGIPPGFTDCEGVGINDRGEVVGTAATSPGPMGLPHQQAFLYGGGKMRDIGTPPGCSESQAVSINAAGLVTGEGFRMPGGSDRSRPFLYDSRTKAAARLPVPPLTRGAWATRTNGKGQTIGTVWTGNNRYHVALWAGGRVEDLGASPGSADSMGVALNGRGEAVGYGFEDSYAGTVRTFLQDHAGGDNALRRYLSRPTEHAFVYQGGKMQDLNDLIPKDADWILESARGINDRGQIVGRGLHHGLERGFLLTPR